jgi:hypothetical protein
MGICGSGLFWRFKLHNNKFKKALDPKKQWRIDLPRLSAHQTEDAEYIQNADV